MTPQAKNILTVYAVLAGSILTGFVPKLLFALLAMVLFSAALSMAGSRRRKADIADDTYISGHMTYIIRTIWITCLVGFFSTIAASVYVLSAYNPELLNQCMNDMMAGTVGPDVAICLKNFAEGNWPILLNGTVIAALPLGLYLALRMGRGLNAAFGDKPITNPKTWL